MEWLILLMVYVGSYVVITISGIIYNWKDIKYVRQLFYPWGDISEEFMTFMSVTPILNTCMIIAIVILSVVFLIHKILDKIGIIRLLKRIGSIEIKRKKNENH